MKRLLLVGAMACLPIILKAQSKDTSGHSKNIGAREKFVNPSFPGGDKGWDHFISYYVHYPKEAMMNNITGKVIIELMVEENGKLTNIHVVSSPSPLLSAESLRVLKLSPKWKPATINGKPVRANFSVPITYTLNATPRKAIK